MNRNNRLGLAIIIALLVLLGLTYRSDGIRTRHQVEDANERLNEVETEGDALATSLDAVIAQVRQLCQLSADLDPASAECQPVSPSAKDIAKEITEGRESIIIRIPGNERDDPDPNDPEIQDPEIQDPDIDEGTGTSITSVALNEDCELIFVFSDGTVANLGNVCGGTGPMGPIGPMGPQGSCPEGSTLTMITINTAGGQREAAVCLVN